MGIEIRPSGEAAAYAGAGKAIGQAKARETAREEAQRAQELAFRQRVEQMSNDWELQKMLLNSQLDFQHEQRMVALDHQKFERAKAWDTEKMFIRSQVDLQMEEEARLKKMQKAGSQADAIQKSLDEGIIGPNDANYQQVMDRLEYYRSIEETGEEPPVSLYTTKPVRTVPEIKAKATAEIRRTLSNIIGPEEASTMSFTELVDEAEKKGIDVSEITKYIEGAPEVLQTVRPESEEIVPTGNYPGQEMIEPFIPTIGQGLTLDRDTALQILNSVGGDKNKARQLASQLGYQF